MAARNSGPERAAPVLEALRLAPGRVKKIAHVVTGKSFGAHWIEIVSDEGRIFVQADDWAALLEQLTRRCPQATVENRGA